MKIAIIGGIGSGKSQVLRVARDMGIVSISADEINAELLRDANYVKKIESAFSGVVTGGVVDKKKLSSIVFANDKEREKLNGIAHPEIMKRIHAHSERPLVVEMPLILGNDQFFDVIIHVATPLDLRVKRLKEGRGIDEDRAKSIIATQPNEAELAKIANCTLQNDKDLPTLEKNARDLFASLLK